MNSYFQCLAQLIIGQFLTQRIFFGFIINFGKKYYWWIILCGSGLSGQTALGERANDGERTNEVRIKSICISKKSIERKENF